MGVVYEIKCKHCKTNFTYSQDPTFGLNQPCIGCETHIETESPIRCPACNSRLNPTEEEFNEQVQTAIFWD